MPKENKQQKQDIVIEKWDAAQLEKRASNRAKNVRSQQRIWELANKDILEEKYGESRYKEEKKKRREDIEKKINEKSRDYLAILMRRWEHGEKKDLRQAELDAIAQLQKEQKEKLAQEEKKLEQEHLKKMQEAEEKLKQLNQVNYPEKIKKQQEELVRIKAEINGWHEKNNACMEQYNKPATSRKEKNEYEKIINEAENRMNELRKKEIELTDEIDQLNEKVEQQKKAIQNQKEKTEKLKTSYQAAKDQVKKTLEVKYQDQIGAHEKRLKDMEKWLYNVVEQNDYESRISEKKITDKDIEREIKLDLDVQKRWDEDQLTRKTNALKKRHEEGLAYYKRVEEMQSTIKKFGAADSEAFKEMIQALRKCGDALIKQGISDEEQNEMGRLGAEAYRKCQSYLGQKRRFLFDTRRSEAGIKRREITTELMDTLLNICPRIEKQLDPEKYSFSDDKKDLQGEPKKEPLNFNKLTGSNGGTGKKQKTFAASKDEKEKTTGAKQMQKGKGN